MIPTGPSIAEATSAHDDPSFGVFFELLPFILFDKIDICSSISAFK